MDVRGRVAKGQAGVGNDGEVRWCEGVPDQAGFSDRDQARKQRQTGSAMVRTGSVRSACSARSATVSPSWARHASRYELGRPLEMKMLLLMCLRCSRGGGGGAGGAGLLGCAEERSARDGGHRKEMVAIHWCVS
jgi:hypothetical protein